MSRLRDALVLALCAGTFAAVVSAQNTVSYAAVSGLVTDASGAVMPDVAITLKDVRTGYSVATNSDGHGRYQFRYLTVGEWTLSAEKKGFETQGQKIALEIGTALDVPIHMMVAGTEETAEVNASEIGRSEKAEVVAPSEVMNLPLNGRNYLDLALLIPGVSRTNTGSTQRFAETSAVPGTGLSVGAQRNLANTFVVDGLSANDDAADLAGTFFSQEVVREFQVITSGATVEFGRALGGVVNVLTQSGGDHWHGDLYEFFRNQRLDARNALATQRFPLTQNQFGASAGGPLLSRRLFFFANYEGLRQNTAGVITISHLAVTAINNRLDAIAYSGPRVGTGQYRTTLNTNNYFGKLDGLLGERDRYNARYSLYDVGSLNSRGVGGLSALSRGTALADHDTAVAVNNVLTITPHLMNETRWQYTRSRLAAPVNDVLGPAVNISGLASFGTSSSSPTGRGLDSYELVDDISIARGNHTLKFGTDFLYNDLTIVFPGILRGQYTFASLTSFLAGRYLNFQQAFGPEAQAQTNPNLAWYAGDEWHARPNLTVHAGLRQDFQFLHSPIQTQPRNVAPRIGLAWSPDRERNTVIRADYGIFYDRIPLRAVSNALQRGGLTYQTALLTPAQFGAPPFPSVLPSFPPALLTNITTIDRSIHNGYSQQASFEVEQRVAKGGALSVAYQHLRGIHLVLSQNQNVPRCTSGFNLCRPDSRFGNNSQYRALGDSYFDGLLVSWTGRAGTWTTYRLSYTYSKAIDDVGQFFFSSPQNNFNIADDRGPSDNDQRHRLVFSGTVQVPGQHWWSGFLLSSIVSYSSALPFNVQTGTDNNGDTNVNDRPFGLGRNAARAFDSLTLDARLSRVFRWSDRWQLETIAEGFNTLNRNNRLFPNNIFGNGPYPFSPLPAFGAPTASADPRQLQLALRVRF